PTARAWNTPTRWCTTRSSRHSDRRLSSRRLTKPPTYSKGDIAMSSTKAPDLVLSNGRITTLDPKHPQARSVALKNGRIVGVDSEFQRGEDTTVIDLNGRRVIPGLNDSHLHVIRGGLNYNMELRWDGVPS